MFFIVSFLVTVAVLAFVIQRLAKLLLGKMNAFEVKQKENNNPYIRAHQLFKIDNDAEYSRYLSWCYKHGQIPMDKQVFLKDVDAREKELDKLINF